MNGNYRMSEYDLLFSACKILAKFQKIKLIRPHRDEAGDLFDFMQKIAESSAIRLRKVTLTNQWWKKDCGPLLGFYQNQPCALIPKKWGAIS